MEGTRLLQRRFFASNTISARTKDLDTWLSMRRCAGSDVAYEGLPDSKVHQVEIDVHGTRSEGEASTTEAQANRVSCRLSLAYIAADRHILLQLSTASSSQFNSPCSMIRTRSILSPRA